MRKVRTKPTAPFEVTSDVNGSELRNFDTGPSTEEVLSCLPGDLRLTAKQASMIEAHHYTVTSVIR